MRRFGRWYILIAGVGLVMVVIAATIYFVIPPPVIPSSIQRQYTAALLVPGSGFGTVQRASAKYDASLKLISFTVEYASTTVVVSEQPTPDSFVDIPAAYDKVIASLNATSKFDVDLGRVYVATPASLAGKQTAVLNAKGTLLFAKPDRNLTDDQWRQLFAHLEVLR